MISSNVANGLWKFRIYTPDGDEHVVGMCDLCRRDAERLRGAVEDWFALGAWHDADMDRLEARDQEDVLYIRHDVKASGLDPRAVRVRLEAAVLRPNKFGVGTAMQGGDDADEWDADDTLTVTDLPLYALEPDGEDVA